MIILLQYKSPFSFFLSPPSKTGHTIQPICGMDFILLCLTTLRGIFFSSILLALHCHSTDAIMVKYLFSEDYEQSSFALKQMFFSSYLLNWTSLESVWRELFATLAFLLRKKKYICANGVIMCRNLAQANRTSEMWNKIVSWNGERTTYISPSGLGRNPVN